MGTCASVPTTIEANAKRPTTVQIRRLTIDASQVFGREHHRVARVGLTTSDLVLNARSGAGKYQAVG